MLKQFWVSALLALSGPAFANDGVSIERAWIRLLPAELPAGGYFVLTNRSDRSVTLTGVSAPSFAQAMLHQSIETDGQGKMRHVDSLEVAAGGTLRFAPGGYHIMLMAPHEPLQRGGTTAVTFQFADGSSRRVEFLIQGPAARGFPESK